MYVAVESCLAVWRGRTFADNRSLSSTKRNCDGVEFISLDLSNNVAEDRLAHSQVGMSEYLFVARWEKEQL